MKTTSYSEISAWKTCRQKWHWAYERRIEPQRYADHITLGTLCHAGMEGLLKGETFINRIYERANEESTNPNLFDEERAQIKQLAETSILIIQRAMRNFQELTGSLGGPALAVELPFEVKVPGTVVKVKGIFDSIIRDRHGLTWVVEWKFPRTFRDRNDVDLSSQLAIYQWAANLLGYEVNGILYNQILQKLPAIPEQLKNGSTSRREIYTDWQTYQQTLIERGDDPKLYEEEMKPKLAEKGFFRSFKLYRPPQRLEAYVSELREVVRDVTAKRKRIYTCENSINCRGCAYLDLCLEVARGENPENMIEAKYQPKDRQNGDQNQRTGDEEPGWNAE